jgi:hypothetical protein
MRRTPDFNGAAESASIIHGRILERGFDCLHRQIGAFRLYCENIHGYGRTQGISGPDPRAGRNRAADNSGLAEKLSADRVEVLVPFEQAVKEYPGAHDFPEAELVPCKQIGCNFENRPCLCGARPGPVCRLQPA